MRRLAQADLPTLKAFLHARAPIAMFPLTNLIEHGLNADHPNGMRFWADDGFSNVLGLSRQGMVQPIFTGSDVSGVRLALANEKVTGVVGVAKAVAQIKHDLNLPAAALDRIEPHFELQLSDLELPASAGLTLVPYVLAPRETLIAWRTAYYIEALETAEADAPALATTHVDHALETGSHRVLMKDDTPLAMTGFNARLPETVMIGGVYTPPALRGRSYAGIAVALHLAEARDAGVKKAVLSAANDAAAAAYSRIGFRKMGSFGITVLDEPVTING